LNGGKSSKLPQTKKESPVSTPPPSRQRITIVQDNSSVRADGTQARALNPYSTKRDSHLAFEKDDIITITRFINQGWWEGTLNGKTGKFPFNYVEIMKDDLPASSQTVDFHVVVTKSYTSSNSQELNLKEGDTVHVTSKNTSQKDNDYLYYGENKQNGEVGWFPSRNVRKQEEDNSNTSPGLQNRDYTNSSQGKTKSGGVKSPVDFAPALALALRTYSNKNVSCKMEKSQANSKHIPSNAETLKARITQSKKETNTGLKTIPHSVSNKSKTEVTIADCSECDCPGENFVANPFKKGYCNQCFHKH